MTERPDPPRLNRQQLLYLLTAEVRRETRPDTPFLDCFTCHQPVESQQARTWVGGDEERLLMVKPCGHRFTYSAKVADMMRARAEAGAATEATGESAGPAGENPAADALAAELHRRAVRLEELRPFRAPTCLGCPAVQVDGEVIGLMGALGIVLGGQVPGGTADELGKAYYQSWIDRQGVR
jgi:hypothetical protein